LQQLIERQKQTQVRLQFIFIISSFTNSTFKSRSPTISRLHFLTKKSSLSSTYQKGSRRPIFSLKHLLRGADDDSKGRRSRNQSASPAWVTLARHLSGCLPTRTDHRTLPLENKRLPTTSLHPNSTIHINIVDDEKKATRRKRKGN
jgi:hypothetical protein